MNIRSLHCLFDAFVVFLHFHYMSIEIRKGIVDHFQASLDHQEPIDLMSMRIELTNDFLQKLYNVY